MKLGTRAGQQHLLGFERYGSFQGCWYRITRRHGIVDGIEYQLAVTRAAPGVIGHSDHPPVPVQGLEVVECSQRGAVGSVSARDEFFNDAQRQNFNFPAHTADTLRVVPHCADDARHMGSVAHIIHWVIVLDDGAFQGALADEVPAAHIIDFCVGIVIPAVGAFIGIGPHVGHEIRVIVIHPGVQYRHHD